MRLVCAAPGVSLFVSSNSFCLRLESTNKRLENDLTQISQQREEEVQSIKQSLSESQSQNQAVRRYSLLS